MAAIAASAATTARAADKMALRCISSHDEALDDLAQAKMREARTRLSECAAPGCPDLVRAECEKQLEALRGVIPTVVFEVKDAAGRDVVAVSVTMDGSPLASSLDGAALEVDPGEHTFTFAMDGAQPVTKPLVFRQGDSGRRERVTFHTDGDASPARVAKGPSAEVGAPAASPPTDTLSAASGNGMKTAAIVLGVAGLGGLAIGSVAAALAATSSHAQTNDCQSSGCGASNFALANNHYNAARTEAALSDVAFIAGGALLATALPLWFVGGHGASQATVSILPSWAPGSAAFVARGEF